MSVHRIYFFIVVFFSASFLSAQNPDIEQRLESLSRELEKIENRRDSLHAEMEEVKLTKIISDLKAWGLPDSPYIAHSAMILSYNERHEQANWVAHVILPDIQDGAVSRTNDFRPDPKVLTGTAEEEDYFLKFLQEDSSYVYDGYGYDRGHLAPSADFRWSYTALSESYYYSNMSPQRPGFNRYSWAELENSLRSYIYNQEEKSQVYVVTGPLLHDSLPYVKRSKNKVSIPEKYFKIAVDLKNERGIGFILPNRQTDAPLETYAASIREIENRLGYDFSNQLDSATQNKIELNSNVKEWLNIPETDVEPLSPTSLPRGHFNTVQAKIHMGKNRKIKVCGTVVAMRKSRSGNLWMNLDKNFPNHIFSAYIPNEKLSGFPYNPMEEWNQKQVCIEGKVNDFDNIPTIRIKRQSQIMAY
ncbi:MAG: DNA/RNA non-specific endonuclease [Bacteroidetes bacterium]|jgi:endonuclease G|nr:DNA/RNA non-specific endonuclease [Bacteroidota bacterium]